MSTTPFVITDSQKVPYQVIGLDAAGLPGASLPAGATVAVNSSDPTVATIAPDSPAVAGAIASGFVVAASPAKLGVIQVNVAVTNADGSAGPTGQGSVQVVAGAEATINVQFGTAVPQ